MSTSRRDFMKMFGVSLASLLLTRCRPREIPEDYVTCYTQVPLDDYTPTPPPASLAARGHLRLCWLRFGELAQMTIAESNEGNTSNEFGQQLVSDHRAALDELIISREITAPVADLVQEAYGAAIYHIWRSNALMTCYEPMVVNYSPTSAAVLVQQSEVLRQFAGQGSVDSHTLEKAQAALEHDLAYYAMSDADIQALYNRLVQEYQEQGQSIPSFEALQLEVIPDARAAAQFIVDLLTGK